MPVLKTGLCFLLLWGLAFTAQATPLDSLARAYRHATDEYTKARYGYALGKAHYERQDYPQALEFLEIALEHGLKTDSTRLLGDCWFALAQAKRELGEEASAMTDLMNAQRAYAQAGQPDRVAITAWAAGKILLGYDQPDRAAPFFEEAQAYFARHTGHPDYAAFTQDYAAWLQALGRYPDALTFYTIVKNYYQERDLAMEWAQVELEMGGVMETMGEYARAMDHYRVAEEVGEQENILWLKCLALSHLGRVYALTGEISRAEAQYREALGLAGQFAMAAYEVCPLQQLVDLLLAQERTEELSEWVPRLAEVLPTLQTSQDLGKAQSSLYRAYKQLGLWAEALTLAETMAATQVPKAVLADSLRGAQVGAALDRVLLAHTNDALANSLAQETRRLTGFAVALVLAILLLIGSGLWGRKQHQKLKAALRAQSKLAESAAEAMLAQKEAESELQTLQNINRQTQRDLEAILSPRLRRSQ